MSSLDSSARREFRFAALCLSLGVALHCSAKGNRLSGPLSQVDGLGAIGGLGGGGAGPVINPCDDVTCPQGAECRAERNGAACVCQDESCDRKLLCQRDSCDENATCNQRDNGYTCACDDGFSGNGFECFEGDLCEDLECSGQNSQCVTDGITASCACLPGFAPGGAEGCVDVDECESSANCDENAVCINTLGAFVCDCEPGFEANGLGGCEKVDLCSLDNVCADLGMVCEDYFGYVTCGCPAGQHSYGDGCKSEPDCAEGMCKNGGTCIERKGGFACACPKGTTGEFCEDSATCALDVVLNDPEHPVIEDEVLRAFLEGQVVGFEGGELTVRDLLGIVSVNLGRPLSASGAVSTLAGLECLPNLFSLSLPGHEISDLGPLEHHNDLGTVNLSCNPLSSLAPLAGKTSIQTLDVSWYQDCPGAAVALTSLEPIASLPNLSVLRISHQGIASNPGWDRLPGLRELDVSFNPLDPVTELGTMHNLETLIAIETAATSLGRAESFPVLRSLNLARSSLHSLVGIGGAGELRELVVDGTSIDTLNGLESAPLLRELRAREAGLSSAAPLSDSRSLIEARLGRNSIARLDDLLGASPLRFSGELNLMDNPLDCAELEDHGPALLEANIFVTADCP